MPVFVVVKPRRQRRGGGGGGGGAETPKTKQQQQQQQQQLGPGSVVDEQQGRPAQRLALVPADANVPAPSV